MRSRSAAVVSVVLVVLGGAACGSSYTPSAAARHAFVEARATALCKVKTQSFSDEHALEVAYTASQHANFSDRDSRVLKKKLENDQALREEISTRVASLCA
jgi:hypothetical protein